MKAALLGLLICIFSSPLYTQLPPLHPQLQVKSEINNLKHGDARQRKAAMFALHETGMNALPLLIESIDDTEPFDQILLANPLLSYIPPEALKKTHVGILSAYTVELILGRKALRGNPHDFTFLVGPEDCVYNYGMLKRVGESVSHEDLERIKDIYVKWWEAHKGMTLEQLRQEWSDNKRPLTGSAYKWL
jgi:hypothetical protein